jgi:hypothetical protein
MLLPTPSAYGTLGLPNMRTISMTRIIITVATGLVLSLGFVLPASTAFAATTASAHAGRKKHHQKHPAHHAATHGRSKKTKPPAASPAPTGEL